MVNVRFWPTPANLARFSIRFSNIIPKDLRLFLEAQSISVRRMKEYRPLEFSVTLGRAGSGSRRWGFLVLRLLCCEKKFWTDYCSWSSRLP